MSDPKSVDLSGVSETLLITLHLRAEESQRPDAMIKGGKAVALIELLNYDFSWMEQIPLGELEKITLMMRTREFDRYAQDFLKRYPEGTVVHIGCGFDTRFERVDNGSVEWYDLDLPEVISQRRKLIGDEGERYHLLGFSVYNNGWLNAVSANYPYLFLAEGFSMYFEEAQVKSLLLTLRDHFPGAEMVFDAFSPFHIWRSNLQVSIARLGARFPRLHWGLWSGKEVEGWGESICLLDDWGYLDPPQSRLSRYRWMRHIPLMAKAGRLYHFRLGKDQ